MSIVSEIFRTWRDPKGVALRLFSEGPREDRALIWLMLACVLIFIAQLPRLQRQALGGGDEFARLASYEALAWLFVWPLAFYLFAAIVVAILRLFRWKGQGWHVRAALFWGLLAASPVALLYGALNGLGVDAAIIGAIWLLAILVFWTQGLRAGHRAAL